MDGTLLKAWASLKSFQPKDQKGRTPPDDLGNPTVDFHVERRPTRRTRRRAIRTVAGAERTGQGSEAELQRQSAVGKAGFGDSWTSACGSQL